MVKTFIIILLVLYCKEMKTKISIITPVHIGTGEDAQAFEYRMNNNVLYKYNISDIFSQIPSQTLLNSSFLNSLTDNKPGSKKEILNSTLSNVNYHLLKPTYQLRYDFNRLTHKNISIQMKTLDIPIIPGSSLKGAIINAIQYDIVKNNLPRLYKEIEQGNTYRFKNFENILKMIYPKLKDIDTFFKDLSSCIIVEDVQFKKMCVVHAKREKVYLEENNSGIPPLPCFECIDFGQARIGDIIRLDKDKFNILKSKYPKKHDTDYLKLEKKYFRYKSILILMNQYFEDMMEEELEIDNTHGFYSSHQIGNSMKKLYKENIDNGFYMRIGRNTNYFFKTVSYAIKKDNPELYKKYFYQLFTPKNKPKKRGAYPTPDKMPATRVLYFDDNYDYYPGVIKVEYIIKDKN